MKKFLAAVGVLVLGTTLAVAGPGEGEGHGKGKGKGKGMWSERLSEKLGLSDAQRGQIQSIQQNFRTANEPFFTAHRELKQQYRDARQAGDTARAESLKGQLDAQKTQMRQLHESLQTQIVSVLTAEQRAKFEAMKAERDSRGGKRGGRTEKF